jgi:hypothetical protein
VVKAHLSNVISRSSLQQNHAVFEDDVSFGCVIVVAAHSFSAALGLQPFFVLLLGGFQLLLSSTARKRKQKRIKYKV